jgi:hypothetical protein
MRVVGRRPERSQSLEGCVPNRKLAPAGKAHENRVPIAGSAWHVAPRRAGAQDPKDAVDRAPLSAGRARHGRGEGDRKCAIPRPSERLDSLLPPYERQPWNLVDIIDDVLEEARAVAVLQTFEDRANIIFGDHRNLWSSVALCVSVRL